MNATIFSKNLIELRQQRNLTHRNLALKLGISNATISRAEKGSVIPDTDTVGKIADFFGVTVDYLLGNISEMKGIKIPVLGSIPAGIPLEAITDILDYEEIPEKMAKSGEYFALKVKGDSMAPKILNGDIVIIRKQEDAESGNVCVVMINGYDATLKEIKKDTAGIWVLPYNPNSDFKPTFYSKKEIEELPVRIIGVAVEIRRSL